MRSIIIILSAIIFISCGHEAYKGPHVLVSTNMGDIELELYPDKAPKTVANFLSHVDQHLYDNGSFYRVIKDDNSGTYKNGLIQGGIVKTTTQKYLSLQGIEHESPKQTGLSHTSGTISMARTTPGSAKSEFFICIGDQTQFDSSRITNPDGLGYAAFGKVYKGMDVVRKIQGEKSSGEEIVVPIVIRSIKRVE